MTDDEAVLQQVVDAELALLDPAVRTSASRTAALLHPDFREVGASGRMWDLTSILAMMATETAAEHVMAQDVRGERLAADVVHLSYTSVAGHRRARRTSVWRRTEAGWLLWFHQGTLLPPATR